MANARQVKMTATWQEHKNMFCFLSNTKLVSFKAGEDIFYSVFILYDLHILLLMAPWSRSVHRQQIRKRKLKIPAFQSYCFLFHHPRCDQFVPASWGRNTDASLCFDQRKVKHGNTNWIRQSGLGAIDMNVTSQKSWIGIQHWFW